MVMKIAIIGYGKMGKLIEQSAHDRGHATIARFSKNLGTPQERSKDLEQADMVFDFSHSSAVIDNLSLCLSLKKPIVIGTTGWDEQIPQADHLVKENQGSCLYAPNFSIGVYLFQSILTYAASLFQAFPEYEISGIEMHHRHKMDEPSGTAKMLKQQMLSHLPRLTDFPLSSIRSGYIPGTHTLQFDSPADTLVFTHQARNRQGFAEGAVMGAEWLMFRKGFFSIHDMMKELYT